jgi:hypothetical protein
MERNRSRRTAALAASPAARAFLYSAAYSAAYSATSAGIERGSDRLGRRPILLLIEAVAAHAATGIGAKTEPARNPDGYCGLGGTGVACPVGLAS